MKCKNCGSELKEGSLFCAVCGAKQEETPSNFDINQQIDNMNSKNANYLLPGEKIIARAKWTLVPFIIVWVLYFIGLLIGSNVTRRSYYDYGYYYRSGNSLNIVIWVISIVICALSIIIFLARRELVLTDKKLYGRIGLICTKQFIIPLSKINYISVRYGIITRILNSAIFMVFPANSLFGIMFFFVANATEFRKAVEEEVYKHLK